MYSMLAIHEWASQGDILPKFERRVTLCSAENLKEAEAKLLREAREYSQETISFHEEYTIHELMDDDFSSPCEVSSELTIAVDERGDSISYEDFMLANWDYDRLESCENIGLEHAWHKGTDHLERCYNCRKTKKV